MKISKMSIEARKIFGSILSLLLIKKNNSAVKILKWIKALINKSISNL